MNAFSETITHKYCVAKAFTPETFATNIIIFQSYNTSFTTRCTLSDAKNV